MTASRRSIASAPRQRGRIARRLAWAGIALVLLAGAVLASLTWGPHLMRERIAARIGETIGREVGIGRIDVSPFAGRVAVADLRIASSDASRAMLSVPRTVLEVDLLASLRGLWTVRSVGLESPAVRIVRVGQARFDLSDIVDRFAGGPPSERRTEWRVDHVRIDDGRVEFDDRVVRKATTLDALALSVRGLTNAAAQVDQPATVDAALRVDGRPLTVAARATPFAERPGGDGTVRLDALPIASVLPYLPMPDDVKVVKGTLAADLRAAWRPAAASAERLVVEGEASLDGIAVRDAANVERLSAESLSVRLASSTPLGGKVHVAELLLRAPRAESGRRADGGLEWPARGVPVDAPAATSASTAPAARPASIRIDSLAVTDARIGWRDAALPAPLALRIEPLSLTGRDLEVPDLSNPRHALGTVALQATADAQATLAGEATLEGETGRASVALGSVDLARYAPLAGPALRARVEQGHMSSRASVAWNTAASTWSVTDGAAEVSGLRVAKDNSTPAEVDAFAIGGVAIDGAARRVEVASATLAGARLALRRARDGRFDLQDWYVADAAPVVAPVDPDPSTAGAPATPWTLRIAGAELASVQLDYDDAAIPRNRKLPRVTLNAKASDITLDASARVPFEASVALADGSRLTARGAVRPTPLDLDAQLRLQRLTVTHFDPYVAPYVNVALASGQLWSSGRLRVSSAADGALARIGFDGEVSANEFRAIDKVSSDDFLRWTALAMPSVKVDWRPARVADSLVEVGAVAFVDFYSRIILGADGRLNLSDILVDPDERAERRSLTAAPDAARVPAPAASARGDAPRPTIRIGTVRIAGGRVNFTDLFVRPNYTANLTQLVGSIDALASDRAEPSDVLVTGRVDDDTPLEITGKVNPLAPRNFIDLRSVARGFDLPKLSPYSGRWAGYAIEKGKLTADVRYRIEGDRLTAENKLTINQLTFGDRIESPDATSLPVRLAVSLLKDRNGNIDLDLPISGTLSDPQFSVGGLLWRAIGNLIVKVVASPFTLLASLGGADAAELSHIAFAAGTSTLDDEDRGRLDGLAKALQARPELSIEIAGVADVQADGAAVQRERLERALRGQKLVQMRRADPSAELPALSEVRLDDTERARLLERAWRDAKLDAGSGGNVPPPDELERQLAGAAPVATEDVRGIAQQRAQAARDYLRDARGIADERLFVLAPRIAEAGDARPPARADFTVK